MKRGWRGLTAVLALGAGIALTWRFWPREPVLLEHAAPVLTSPEEHYWLSNRELMLVREADLDKPSPRLSCYDIVTHTEMPLAEATRLAQKQHVYWQPSPDRQWLLGKSDEGYIDPGSVFSIKMDGSLQQQIREKTTNSPIWMADSRHWMELILLNSDSPSSSPAYKPPPTYGLVHELAEPKNIERLPIETKSPLNRENIKSRLMDSVPYAPYHLLIDGTVKDEGDIQAEILDIDLKKGGMPTHIYMPPLPPGQIHYLKSLNISPQGDRIAWWVESRQTPPFAVLLNRLYSGFKVEETMQMSLWVSALDGSNMRLLGRQKITRNDEMYDGALGFQWLPDGKSLSFEYKNTLYTLPVL